MRTYRAPSAILRKHLWRFALRKRRSILGITGAVVAMVALTGSVMAAGPLFANGSFEDGAYARFVPGYDFGRLPAGSTDLTGWMITGGGVDWVGTYWQAAHGSKSVDLDGSEE